MKFASQRAPMIAVKGSGAGEGFAALGGGVYGRTCCCVARCVPRSAQDICAAAAAGASEAKRSAAMRVLFIVVSMAVAGNVDFPGIRPGIVLHVFDREPAFEH